MENTVNIHIKKLPTGYYLATAENFSGLVAKGKNISEALDAAKILIQKFLRKN